MKIRKEPSFNEERALQKVCREGSSSEEIKSHTKIQSTGLASNSILSYVFESHDEDIVKTNPLIDAFLKIGAIAEKRQEMLMRRLISFNFYLDKRNKEAESELHLKDQTIKSLKIEMESTIELSSEQSKQLQTYVEELKIQISESENNYKILYQTFIDLTNRQATQLKKYENIVELMKSKVRQSKDNLKKIYELHRKCPSTEEYNRIISRDETITQVLNDNEKSITSLKKQIRAFENERETLDTKLNREIKKQKDLLDRLNLQESEIVRLKSEIKELLITDAACKEVHKRDISALNNKHQLMLQQIEMARQSEKSLEIKNKELLQRLSKLNEEIYYSKQKEKDFEETIYCLEQQISEKEDHSQMEIEKYLAEISCLKDKMAELECAVATCGHSSINADKYAGDARLCSPLDISYPYHQTDKVLSTIAEKMTAEQTKCHNLVDKIHALRMEFVKTQEEITHLRKGSNCKTLIHEKMMYENKLTYEITLAEGEWRRSVAQSRALLNTLCMINKTDLPKDSIADYSIT